MKVILYPRPSRSGPYYPPPLIASSKNFYAQTFTGGKNSKKIKRKKTKR